MDRTSTWWRELLIAVLLLGLSTLLLGVDMTGRLCVLFVPLNAGVRALRRGRFSFAFGPDDLVRATRPRGFWAAIAICALLAAAQSWVLIDHLLHPARR